MIRSVMTLCLALFAMAMGAQSTATDYFVSAPIGVLPLIDTTTRLDMMDYFHSGSSTESTNTFNGRCVMKSESPESVTFMATDDIKYQLAILPADKDTVVVLIETIPTPIPDSRIAFYTSSWRPLGKAPFAEPSLKDWLNDSGGKARKEVEEALPFIMASYEYFPETSTLVITNNTGRYFTEEETPRALALLKASLKYRWNGKKFEKIKP